MPDAADRYADFVAELGLARPTREQSRAAAKALRDLLAELGFVDRDRHDADVIDLREEMRR